jgi:DNA primase catalytic core
MPTAIESVLREIRERLSLSEYLVSKGFHLRQTGRNRMVGLCPFHADKRRPNMVVYTDEHRFHCFCCGARGDVVDMARCLDGHINFSAALRALATSVGLTFPYDPPQGSDDRVGILTLAAKVYSEQLNSDALGYLGRRGFPEPFVRNWRIGYAPQKSPQFLLDHFRQHTVSPEAALASGVLVELSTSGRRLVRDFFGNSGGGYIVFPNPGRHGGIIDLQGRAFPNGSNKPKYLNLPKGRRHLFNETILPRASVILTEGIPDALSCLRVDQSAVAVYGTSGFSDRFVNQFARCRHIYVAFDLDARSHGVEVAMQFGLRGRVIMLPESLGRNGDLNDLLVQRGAVSFRRDLTQLLQSADTGYGAAIQDLPMDLQLYDLFENATALLAALGAVDPISRDVHLQKLHVKYGIAMDTLRDAASEALITTPSTTLSSTSLGATAPTSHWSWTKST